MRAVLLLLFGASLASFAPPRQDPKNWLSIKEWWGTIEVVTTNEGSVKEGSGEEYSTEDWKDKETSFFTFHLDHRSRSPLVFRGTTLPSIAELTESERWQAWTVIRDPVEYTVEGESESKSVSQDYGEARSIIRDVGESTGTRTGGGKDRSAKFALQVDIKNAKYAFEAPVMRLIHSRDVTSRARWSTVHTQEPSGYRDEDSGDGYGASRMRGTFKNTPDGELDGIRILDQPLPAGVQELAGSMTFPVELPPGRAKGSVKGGLVITWTFTMTPPPPIELELEAEGDGGMSLANWRPKGGPDEQTPGSFVKIKAAVVARGGPLPDKPEYIAIRLTSSSREKGVCMNFPEKPLDRPEDDFRFRDAENGKNRANDTMVRVMKPPKPELEATLACFDHGAWGEVTATARLESGRRLLARVKGKPDLRKLELPERKAGSKIAVMWNAAGSDKSDDDNTPPGDGQKGDGLTTYEEYRGFMVGGAWKHTDPATKDFFIRNEAGAVADPGINLFKSLSNLEIHRLAAGEMAGDRIINRNRTDGPNVVDQHGIRMVYRPAVKGYCQAVSTRGKPGLPKDSVHVLIGAMPPNTVTTDTGGGTKASMPYSAPTVAHELFHCCNVWHHGEDLPGFENDQTWILENSGDIKESGRKISVVDEAGTNIESKLSWTAMQKIFKIVTVHTWRGTSSGDTGCVMRYDNARAFILPVTGTPIPGERRWLLPGDEVVGGGLCTTTAATGTNLPRGTLPGRFGPAQNNRGNCAGQIVVSDKATPTTR